MRDQQGRVLVAERRGDRPFSGLWEFPGGKIAAGETAEAALERELAEEIGLQPLTIEPLLQLEHDYEDRLVAIDFFVVSAWRGEPAGLEGQRLRWVEVFELAAEQLLPADAPVIEALRNQQMLN